MYASIHVELSSLLIVIISYSVKLHLVESLTKWAHIVSCHVCLWTQKYNADIWNFENILTNLYDVAVCYQRKFLHTHLTNRGTNRYMSLPSYAWASRRRALSTVNYPEYIGLCSQEASILVHVEGSSVVVRGDSQVGGQLYNKET